MFHTMNQEGCVVRATHILKGRRNWLAPDKAAVRNLHYGRMILDPGAAPLEFSTARHETGLICLRGQAHVGTDGQSFDPTRYDSLYVPRDSTVTVAPGEEGCDLAEISAPVSQRYPLQFVAFSDVRKVPALHFQTGGAFLPPRPQHSDRQEHPGRPHPRGGHLQRTGQLDLLAAPRARRHA